MKYSSRYHEQLFRAWRSFLIPPGRHLIISHPAQAERIEGSFDTIVIEEGALGSNPQATLEKIAAHCQPQTRLVLEFGRRTPSKSDLITPHFIPLTWHYHTLLPWWIPGLSWLCNTIIAQLPLMQLLCRHRALVLRVAPRTLPLPPSVSVIIPCRNERGNIEGCIARCPDMGSSTEFIFVDGHSTDGTYEEIVRIQKQYSSRKIRAFKQPGRGKGDAVFFALEQARGDIVMILDSDLTVPPEQLPEFFDALVKGTGECINGTRFIHPRERDSMPFVNRIANWGFAQIVSQLTRQPHTDTLCGTKAFWRCDSILSQRAKNFFGTLTDPFGDFDILFSAARLHRSIIDIPVHYKKRTYGSSQVAGKFSLGYVKNGFRLLVECARFFIRTNRWRGGATQQK